MALTELIVDCGPGLGPKEFYRTLSDKEEQLLLQARASNSATDLATQSLRDQDVATVTAAAAKDPAFAALARLAGVITQT